MSSQKSVKYLDITIDNNLKFSERVKETPTKAKEAKFTLYPLINQKSPLSLNTKLYIYKSYTRPIILYVISSAWSVNLSRSNWEKLEALGTIHRLITGSDWFVYNFSIRNSLKILSSKETALKD